MPTFLMQIKFAFVRLPLALRNRRPRQRLLRTSALRSRPSAYIMESLVCVSILRICHFSLPTRPFVGASSSSPWPTSRAWFPCFCHRPRWSIPSVVVGWQGRIGFKTPRTRVRKGKRRERLKGTPLVEREGRKPRCTDRDGAPRVASKRRR